MPMRVAVLASGGGSNLQALVDHLAPAGREGAAAIALVVSDRADAGALDRARRHGIARLVADPREAGVLDGALADAAIDLVVLAGYLKLVPAAVTARFRGRMINIHPALLPAFGGPGMYGARVHRAVLDAGARVSGPTVHFVDEAYDRGAIIAQWPVPVLDGDTPDSLARRVLRVEHVLLPRTVEAIAAGRVSLGADGRVRRARDPGLDDASFALARHAAPTLEDVSAALGGAAGPVP